MSTAIEAIGTACELPDIGTLLFRGPDARKFLQGQLSNDLARLSSTTLLRAGLHTPQGRTLALLWLAATPADEVLAMLPRELLDGTLALLRRYVLRSKVDISDQSARWRVLGLALDPAAPQPGQLLRYGLEQDTRVLLLQNVDAAPPLEPSMSRTAWRARDIAAGLPQLYAPTSGQFVAQMLNLDCIDAISFTKGCYTGQEVIARAHYRGRVKRRMQRLLSATPLQLTIGDSARLDDGRSMRVVEAVQHLDGRCEFLAVGALPGSSPEAEEQDVIQRGAGIACTTLPLPYALP